MRGEKILKVDIYIETSSQFQGKVERKCGYVLSTLLRGREETRKHFGTVSGTYHQAVLLAIADALEHMTRSCLDLLTIHFCLRYAICDVDCFDNRVLTIRTSDDKALCLNRTGYNRICIDRLIEILVPFLSSPVAHTILVTLKA